PRPTQSPPALHPFQLARLAARSRRRGGDRPGPPGIESIEFRIINIAANGPVVTTERIDVFKLSDKSFELPVMGTFEIRDEKIHAWRDYFDANQFARQLG